MKNQEKILKSLQLGRHSRRLIMNTEENLGDLPIDLILNILSRLPSKSIARSRCVSKLWASLLSLHSPNFTDLFRSHSTTRPRLLFTVRKNNGDWSLYSCLQPQISDKNLESSLSITAEFHMSLLKPGILEMSPPISGLIYFPNTSGQKNPLLCNPSTRHLWKLPELKRAERSYFGYDPIDKQFCVLAITRPPLTSQKNYQILKLGSERVSWSWRSLECPLHHHPLQMNICIDGILYYIARIPSKLVSFDFKTEKFKFIDQPWPQLPHRLVNFKGKLGGINQGWRNICKKKSNFLSLWVLEDVEKQEWCEHVYNLPPKLWKTKCESYYILGVTGKGDIVLTLLYMTNPFYVYFFNLEKKRLQKVEIEGVKDVGDYSFHGCVDYVEELRGF